MSTLTTEEERTAINVETAARLQKIIEEAGLDPKDTEAPPPIIFFSSIRGQAREIAGLLLWRIEQKDVLNRPVNYEEVMSLLTAIEAIATQIRVALAGCKE